VAIYRKKIGGKWRFAKKNLVETYFEPKFARKNYELWLMI
jgi:hypothetical protein